MKFKNTLALFISLIICQGAGLIGALFTTPAIPTWYAGIVKPALNPPSWVFGPVWTTLYILMAIAAFIIWKHRGHPHVRKALGIFALQLALNSLWSIVFFGLQSPGGAFIIVILLWLAILWTILSFYRISRPTLWLLVPYLLWVSFASYLNCAIWMLN